ncbi:(Fe-S)-binding protein [Desulfovibrio sp. 86]|uniref:Putative 4Fe-4S binding domain protein n=1 Tax=uncultured Desulfovibrio sp. TaxID=167968 RepID=A0A212KZC6_9BACT|nr:(Fe-S)-binding protein [Desulfovibrio sp. 86]SCM70489.1 putative 4Fe-4S binding domain protein [uncultured Desulfovibrio sp.]VZH32312.1 putative 4Fe-4S binding domain protein [Desulfovibrio sp. 86]
MTSNTPEVPQAVCLDCHRCERGCPMLMAEGRSPHSLLQEQSTLDPQAAVACTECGYCEAVCPAGLSLQKAVQQHAGKKTTSQLAKLRIFTHQWLSFSSLLRLQKTGNGSYSHYAFMPGCSLAGGSPQTVQEVYRQLAEFFPGIGLVMDCCARPSAYLLSEKTTTTFLSKLEQGLKNSKIQKLIVACPNCFSFLSNKFPQLEIISLYPILASMPLPVCSYSEKLALHDPCQTRNEPGVHSSVRQILAACHISYEEFADNRQNTQCCGHGNMLAVTMPKLAQKQRLHRAGQTSCHKIVTYCRSCSEAFDLAGKKGIHLLDLIFDPQSITEPHDFQNHSQSTQEANKTWMNKKQPSAKRFKWYANSWINRILLKLRNCAK